MKKSIPALALSLSAVLLSACGDGGPSKSDISKAISTSLETHLANVNGAFGPEYDAGLRESIKDVTVHDCTASEVTDMHRCHVTVGGGRSAVLGLFKRDGEWVFDNQMF